MPDPRADWRNHPALKIALIILGGIAVCVAIGFLGQKILTLLGVAAGAVMIVGAAIIGALIFIWFVLWIIFPVFVYYGLKRIENLLEAIERNTRR